MRLTTYSMCVCIYIYKYDLGTEPPPRSLFSHPPPPPPSSDSRGSRLFRKLGTGAEEVTGVNAMIRATALPYRATNKQLQPYLCRV